MNLKRGFEKVLDGLKTDDAIQILSMIGVGGFLFIILIILMNIVEGGDATLLTFFGGVVAIALAIWGTYEVTEAGKDNE